jgi:hypothetical protein
MAGSSPAMTKKNDSICSDAALATGNPLSPDWGEGFPIL